MSFGARVKTRQRQQDFGDGTGLILASGAVALQADVTQGEEKREKNTGEAGRRRKQYGCRRQSVRGGEGTYLI